jgi:hypothetical protein
MSAAAKANPKKMSNITPTTAHKDGVECGLIDVYANPFDMKRFPVLWQAWEDGYDQGLKYQETHAKDVAT